MFIYNSSYQHCPVMFHLDHKMSYWLYPRPVSMRLGFTGLSGIVINSMGKSLQSGDVFIFINSTRNQLKLLHQEQGGLVLYSLRISIGRIPSSCFMESPAQISASLNYEELLTMIESAINSPYVRRLQMLAWKL